MHTPVLVSRRNLYQGEALQLIHSMMYRIRIDFMENEYEKDRAARTKRNSF